MIIAKTYTKVDGNNNISAITSIHNNFCLHSTVNESSTFFCSKCYNMDTREGYVCTSWEITPNKQIPIQY